jgi:hypothetical protein
MLRTTNVQLERLLFLRDVVLPKVLELDKQGRVDLDFYMYFSPHGRVCCLLGWAAQEPYYQRQGLRLERDSVFDHWHLSCRPSQFFGITALESEMLFGRARCGDLRRRGRLLDRLIEEKTQALV